MAVFTESQYASQFVGLDKIVLGLQGIGYSLRYSTAVFGEDKHIFFRQVCPGGLVGIMSLSDLSDVRRYRISYLVLFKTCIAVVSTSEAHEGVG